MEPRPALPPRPESLLAQAGFVRALARSLLADAHAAEDVAQDALVIALERPPRSVSSLRTWLARVTRNLALQSVRGAGRRRGREEAHARPDGPPDPAEVVEREAARAAVVRAVLALSEPSRSAILLRFYEGLPPGRIAARLGIPTETVRTRIKRGLGALRRDLEAQHGGSEAEVRRALAPLAGSAAFASGAEAAAVALPASVLASLGAKLAAAALVAALGLVAWRALAPRAEPLLVSAAPPTADPRERDDARQAQEPASDAPPRVALAQQPEGRRPAEGTDAQRPPAGPSSAPLAADLRLSFMNPDRAPVWPPRAEIRLEGEHGARRTVVATGASSVEFPGLAPDAYTVRVIAPGFVHYAQRFELGPRDPDSGGDGSKVDERVYLWPEDWVALVLRDPDGAPVSALAAELGVEPKNLFVGAFDARARLDPPDEHAWDAPSSDPPAVFRIPRGWQSWELPGGAIGSLELVREPPLWVGLAVHGVPLGWQILRPGQGELVFTLDADTLAQRFATVALRVVDAADGTALREARVTCKADTSAHRRNEHARVAPAADGAVLLTRLIPGRYELAVEGAGALHQELLELAPGETRDLGAIALSAGAGVPIEVVDAAGRPVSAAIEIAPYRRGARTDELYPPNLHRHAGADGAFLLPLPSELSIVRANLSPDDDRSADVLLDPADPPPRLRLVVHEPIEVVFEPGSARTASIEVVDALELVVALVPIEGRKALRSELVPGSYRARQRDAVGALLGETPFEVVAEPVRVALP